MFSIKESIKYGWNKSKENLELAFFTTLLILAVGGFVNAIGDTGRFEVSLLAILASIFLMIVRIGYNKLFLRIHDGEKPHFTEIFQEYRTFWKYLGVSILFPLAVLGGLILLIIPGILWAVRFSFSPLIVIDTKIGPIKAMKESWAITRGNFWHLLAFWIVMGLLNLAGLIVFGIGLLATIPITTFAVVYIYRYLSRTKAGLVETPSPQPAQ